MSPVLLEKWLEILLGFYDMSKLPPHLSAARPPLRGPLAARRPRPPGPVGRLGRLGG